METSGNPVIIDVFRKSGVVSLHHLRGNVGLHEKWLAQKEAPIRGGSGLLGFQGGGTNADRGMTRCWEATGDTTNSIKLL